MNVSKYLSERSKYVKPTYQTSINLDGYINIGSGTPNFFPPQKILNTYKKSIDDYKLTYTSWSGLDDLKVAASNKLKRENNYYADPYSEILITSGAQSAILASLMAILNIDDEVLYKWYLNKEKTVSIPKNRITKKLKEFKIQDYGGKCGMRTHE